MIEQADYDPVANLYAQAFSDITVRKDECCWIDKKIAKYSPERVLDIGCGNGALLMHLSSQIIEGVGVDISSEAIKIAVNNYKNIKNISFSVMERSDLKYSENSFNMVISLLSFRYLEWDKIIPEMLRVIDEKGRILIVDMVESKVRINELPYFLIDKLKNFINMKKNKNFARALNKLVEDPGWKSMLSRNKMRSQIEFTQFLMKHFPNGQMCVLNVGWRAKILAFDSGIVK